MITLTKTAIEIGVPLQLVIILLLIIGFISGCTCIAESIAYSKISYKKLTISLICIILILLLK